MRQTLCIIMLFPLSASTFATNLPSLRPRYDAISKKYKIDPIIMEELLSDLHSNPEPLLRDRFTRCFAACILTEIKTLNADGTVGATTLIENMPKNIANRKKVVEAFKSCSNEKGVDSCETAYKTAVCINRKDVYVTKKRCFVTFTRLNEIGKWTYRLRPINFDFDQ